MRTTGLRPIPDYPGYQKRLSQLSDAVHATHGLWLAPAAVGFDARLNGGTSVVDRRDGATLTAAWSDALATRPDGVALISWNEYTENSYVEPSQNYGNRYLASALVADRRRGAQAAPSPLASPAPPAASASPGATDCNLGRDGRSRSCRGRKAIAGSEAQPRRATTGRICSLPV